jgi:predicted MFS family arabinose efflux permease
MAIVALFFLINTINYLDRQLPYILIEQIKHDLRLSDAEVGFVGGMTFTLVYSLLSIPVARLADSWSAKRVLMLAVTLWCGLTVLSGQARNALQFAATRIGVAAGEAGCTPACHSLISKLVPDAKRPLAIAAFSLGIPAGGTLGLALGGWLGDHYGWRLAMLIVGAPGLILALAIAFLVPDVRSTLRETKSGTSLAGIKALLRQPTMAHIVVGISIQGIAQSAIYAFSAAFLIRSHGMSTTYAGLSLGLTNGTFGVAALLAGGWLATLDNRLALRLAGTAFAFSALLVVAAYQVDSTALSLLLLGMFNFCAVFYMPAGFNTVQMLAPPDQRALASSLVVLGVGLVGGSLGPTSAGLLSDLLTPAFGKDALGFALSLAAVPLVWAGFHLWMASRRLSGDLDAALRPAVASRRLTRAGGSA